MTESLLYENKNTDDIFTRNVIGGLLYLLNRKVYYDQIWQDNVIENVCVPFVYAFVDEYNERFAQDYYTFFGRECFSDKLIDGKFDMIPRGAIKYTSSSIDSGNITNRFVKGTYMKSVDGKLISYSAFFYSIPLTYNFNCEIWVDNILTAFKIEQAIREAFYKNKTYNILYRGMKVGCRVGFPESTTGEKPMTYSFDSERQMKITFALAVETYQPCFDESTAVESDIVIDHFAMDVNHYTSGIGPMDKVVSGSFKGLESGMQFPAGGNVQLEWDTKCNVSDVCTVSLYYTDDDGKHHISSPLFNNGEYMWHIPETMVDFKSPNISYIDTESCTMVEEPFVRIIPDSSCKITADSFKIIDGGKFDGSGTIPLSLDYVTAKGSVVTSSVYSGVVTEGSLTNITLDGTPITYKKKYTNRQISLSLEYPIDGTILDKIDNILIV